MILPKGLVVNENMSTTYINLGELLLDLKGNSFTGYVQITFLDYTGVLFFDGGNVINGAESSGGKRTAGAAAVNRIIKKAADKDGAVSVYEFPSSMVTTLSVVAQSEAVYKDLTTDLTTLDRLLAKLSDERLTGCIEVRASDGSSGIVFLQEGDAVETTFCSLSGECTSGDEGMSRIVAALDSGSGAFDVSKADLTTSLSSAGEVMESFGKDELVDLLQEVLVVYDQAIKKATGDDVFADVFKQIAIGRAAEFPFLDPFANEFVYQGGVLTYNGETALKELIKGTASVLSGVVESVGAAQVIPTIKSGLNELVGKRSDEMAKFGIDRALASHIEG
jgi:hypothetical protein